MPGEMKMLWYRALVAFRRKSDLQHCHNVMEKWNCAHGTLAIQASSEECRGHLKETSVSGNEVTWLTLETGFEVTVNPKSSFSSQIWLSINLRIVRAGLSCLFQKNTIQFKAIFPQSFFSIY